MNVQQQIDLMWWRARLAGCYSMFDLDQLERKLNNDEGFAPVRREVEIMIKHRRFDLAFEKRKNR